MNQVRFQIKAGTAARQAESEKTTDSPEAPRSMRISGGSAARLAENAKRDAPATPPGMPQFSLRAQGGRVFRPDAAPGVPTPDVPPLAAPPASTRETPSHSAGAPAPALTSPAAATTGGGGSSPQSGLLETAASRVQSLLSKLLNPRTPSPGAGGDPTL